MQPASDGSDLAGQLSRLESSDPQQYTLLQRHHQLLTRLLMDCNVNYPSTKQLYELLEDPPFEPQALGRMLTVLAELEIVAIHADRSNRNRYDLTGYTHARMHQLSQQLAANG